MKKFVFATSFLVLAAFSATEASAAYCTATSPTGSSGWGRSPSRARAARMALNQCAIRTSSRYRCTLRYCY
jgi:hypothetical protein